MMFNVRVNLRARCGGGGASARAFSLAEVLLASLIVAGLMVAVLNGVGASATSARVMGDRQTGVLLAERLMNLASALPYADPQSGVSAPLGPDSGEDPLAAGTLDDVDDLEGLSSVPTDPSGKVLTEFAGFTWKARVQYVASGGAVSSSDTGLKRVSVEVWRGGTKVAQLVRVRSSAADAVLRLTPASGQTFTRTTQDALP